MGLINNPIKTTVQILDLRTTLKQKHQYNFINKINKLKTKYSLKNSFNLDVVIYTGDLKIRHYFLYFHNYCYQNLDLEAFELNYSQLFQLVDHISFFAEYLLMVRHSPKFDELYKWAHTLLIAPEILHSDLLMLFFVLQTAKPH